MATTANIGGLAVGPLITGWLARYALNPLTLPVLVFLAALILAAMIALV